MPADPEDDLEDYLAEAWGAGHDYRDGPPPIAPLLEEELEPIASRLRWAERKKAEVDATAERRIEQIRRWQEDRNAGWLRLIGHYRLALEAFCRREYERTKLDKKPRQTWVTPSLRMSLRAATLRRVVDDEDAFVDWVRRNNRLDLVNLKPKIAGALDKLPLSPGSWEESAGLDDRELYLIVADGEPVPGVHAERAYAPTFTAKPPNTPTKEDSSDNDN